MDRNYKIRVANLMFRHFPSMTKEEYESFQDLCEKLDLTVNDIELDKQEWEDILEDK